jgi:hypothetical protein
MNTRFLSLCLLLFSACTLYGQDSTMYNARWITRPSIGVTIPLNKFLEGYITDDLIKYNDANAIYVQVISAAYFFHDRWGVEFNFQASVFSDMSRKGERFVSAVNSEYENDFFVIASTGPGKIHSLIEGDVGCGYLGLIYRIEFGKFLIYPKLAIGLTSLDTDWGNAYLKSKNSNTVQRVRYETEDQEMMIEFATIAPSILFGYKLSRRLFANLELTTAFSPVNITYSKTTTDLYSEQATTEKYHYKKNITRLGLGAGLIIVLGFRD